MDLSTEYLGLKLKHPLMPGASPLGEDLDTIRQLEDAGVAAIVLPSLFEEEISGESRAMHRHRDVHEESFSEAVTMFPSGHETLLRGPETYLELIDRVKSAVGIPVIASLNGVSEGGWLSYAKLIADAGADALEMNVYYLSTDPSEKAGDVEERVIRMVRQVKAAVDIPLAVKLGPFYSSLAHFAHELVGAGADGLVLFNRFYQADIDVEELEVERRLHFSHSPELLLRLRWLAILSERLPASLAATGGVHTALDAIKAVMAGAHAVQIVAALLHRGPAHFARILADLELWLEEHEYDSLRQMQGSMNLERCPDPTSYARANYISILKTWKA